MKIKDNEVKDYPIEGPFDAAECPFECEFPPDLSEVFHGTTFYGYRLEARSPSSEYPMDADIIFSHTHEAAVDLLIEDYLDEFASGQQPTWSPFAIPVGGSQTPIVILFEGPITLKGGYQCYHVTGEKVIPSGEVFSSFHAKALLGDSRVDFRFHAPARAEEWKDRWLNILMSFQLCDNFKELDKDEF